MRACVHGRPGMRRRRVCSVDSRGRLYDLSVRAVRSVRSGFDVLRPVNRREVGDVRVGDSVPVMAE